MAPTSSPSQALDFHLSMFRRAQAEGEYVAAAAGDSYYGDKSVLELNKMRNTYRWVQFANTYSRPAMQWDPETGKLIDVDTSDASIGYLVDGRTYSEKEIVLTPETLNGSVLQTGFAMAQLEWSLLNEARTHFITSEMRALVTEASELAEPEPMFESDMPCPSGLLVFETPLIVDDLHPDTGEPLGKPVMPIRAMGWRLHQIGARDGESVVPGVILINYTTSEDYNSIFVPRMAELGHEVDPAVVPGEVWPIEYHPWAFGTEWSSVDRLGEQGIGKLVSTVAYHRRWMLSLFRIMWQRIVAPDLWQPSRQGRRAIERSKVKPKLDGESFSVLVLRRFVDTKRHERNDPDDWAEWPYPYRIPVEPHWRRQHYPSLGPARTEDGHFNVESHRLIYIDRHARGPEHLPILQKHKVTAVVR